MAKCRMLIQENQELGRQLSQGRIAQLEAELALQKKYSEELKSSQDGEDMSSIYIFQPDHSNLESSLDFFNKLLFSWFLTLFFFCSWSPVSPRAEWLYHPAGRGGGGDAEHHSRPAAAVERLSSAADSKSGVDSRSGTEQDFTHCFQLIRWAVHPAWAGQRTLRTNGQRLREGLQWTKQWQLLPEERDHHT